MSLFPLRGILVGGVFSASLMTSPFSEHSVVSLQSAVCFKYNFYHAKYMLQTQQILLMFILWIFLRTLSCNLLIVVFLHMQIGVLFILHPSLACALALDCLLKPFEHFIHLNTCFSFSYTYFLRFWEAKLLFLLCLLSSIEYLKLSKLPAFLLLWFNHF